MNNDYTQISAKVPKEIKDQAYVILKELGVKPTDLIRDVLAYVVERREIPVKPTLMSDEDKWLLSIVRERLDGPADQIRKTTTDELRARLSL